MEILRYVAAIVVPYLIGSISVAVLLTKYVLKKDVRKAGSGNAGATNVARVFGLNLGVVTLLGDILKTIIAMLFGKLVLGEVGLILAAAGCIVGHCWPIYFGFKGGKGVAVGAATALMLDWRFFLLLVLVFFTVAIITKIVSISSITAAVSYPIFMFLLGMRDPLEMALGIFIAAAVVFMHRGNIKRLLNRSEPKFKLKK